MLNAVKHLGSVTNSKIDNIKWLRRFGKLFINYAQYLVAYCYPIKNKI